MLQWLYTVVSRLAQLNNKAQALLSIFMSSMRNSVKEKWDTWPRGERMRSSIP